MVPANWWSHFELEDVTMDSKRASHEKEEELPIRVPEYVAAEAFTLERISLMQPELKMP